MRVVVYEPGSEARAVLCEQLRDLGCSVAPFRDAQVAFLFLLGRLHEVDGVVVSVDQPRQGRWLIEHLELVRQPLAVVTYSGGDGASAAEIHESLLVDRPRSLRRWGARDALGNTQEDNDRSLRLYLRSGFVLQSDDLAVLHRPLVEARPVPQRGGHHWAALGPPLPGGGPGWSGGLPAASCAAPVRTPARSSALVSRARSWLDRAGSSGTGRCSSTPAPYARIDATPAHP